MLLLSNLTVEMLNDNFFNQMMNRIAAVQIEFLWRKSNRQNSSNRDFNPNHNCYLPITDDHAASASPAVVCVSVSVGREHFGQVTGSRH